jgi:hypothetical protein
MRKDRLRVHLLLLFLVTAISCGGGSSGGGTGQASVRIVVQFPEVESSEVVSKQVSTRQGVEDIRIITITIEDGFPTIERTFDVTDLPLEERIFVPVGSDRIVTVRARDINGLLIAIGSTTIDVFPGASNTATIQLQLVGEVCDDGIDNNEDGDTDCADPDCDGERCDPEDDSFVCEDGQCVIPTPTPTPTPPAIESLCFDNMDNDKDDLVDCADPDCEGRICRVSGVSGVCDNGACRIIDLVPSINDICGVDFTVTNQGNTTAPASVTQVVFFIEDDSGNPGTASANLNTPSLSPGQSASFSVDPGTVIPSGSFCFVPNCVYTIEVDANNQIPESDEGNNTIIGLCPG